MIEYEFDQLQGRVTRTAEDSLELLIVALSAARKGRMDVVMERLEVVIDKLQQLIKE